MSGTTVIRSIVRTPGGLGIVRAHPSTEPELRQPITTVTTWPHIHRRWASAGRQCRRRSGNTGRNHRLHDRHGFADFKRVSDGSARHDLVRLDVWRGRISGRDLFRPALQRDRCDGLDSKHVLFRQHRWMRRIGEHPAAIRNHRRNLPGDRRQPYECPIDSGQRILERRA